MLLIAFVVVFKLQYVYKPNIYYIESFNDL